MRSLIFSLVLIMTSCSTTSNRNPANTTSLKEEAFPKIIDESALNVQVNPCDNFYEFSCGQWIKSTVIPADKSSVNRQSTALIDQTDINLNKIILSFVNNTNSNPTINAKKIAALYTSCLNATENSNQSMTVMKDQLKLIRSMKSQNDLARVAALLSLDGVSPFLAFGSSPSLQDSEIVIADISQGGYSLGEKDYYFNKDKKSLEIVKKYKEYIAEVFHLLGHNKLKAKLMAHNVYEFEKKLSAKSYSIADRSDSSKLNHPVGLVGLKKLAPNFDWETYFMTLRSTNLSTLNIDEPEFFQGLNDILKKTNQETLNNYLTWLIADHAANYIGGTYEQTSFNFWSKYLSGATVMKPRWKKCTQVVENSFGYALAEAYVKTIDGDVIKSKTEEMIKDIKSSFTDDLKTLTWLDDQTEKLAEEKVETMGQKVGAPEEWRDYSKLKLNETNYYLNSIQISQFESFRDLAKIGKPVDKKEWSMMPWEVNAYYEPSRNEFNFPFGILQPPSLDITASEGVNLGAFGGGTIGHELTHGFDTNGSQFDNHGNLKSWWSIKTLEQFKEKAQCFIDQGSAYKVEAVGLNVKGGDTLTENLADQGGVKLGYLALLKSLARRAEAPLWLNKYNERQQYWIAYGQSWCTKVTPEALRQQMTSDVHPPAEFRVNEVMMNRPEFAKDFNCPEKSKMAPMNRCSLW